MIPVSSKGIKLLLLSLQLLSDMMSCLPAISAMHCMCTVPAVVNSGFQMSHC